MRTHMPCCIDHAQCKQNGNNKENHFRFFHAVKLPNYYVFLKDFLPEQKKHNSFCRVVKAHTIRIMDKRLKDKVAIVTGGATGIGEAICKKFVKEGAKVIVCGFPDDPVDEVTKEIMDEGGVAVAYKGDISMEVKAKECVKLALDTYGKLDILINNAGVFPAIEYLQDFPIDAFHSMMRNNIQSTFMMTRAALPSLQESKGCIVSAGSESGLIGLPQNAPYAGTKGFIHAFTKSLAIEQAHYGVRANAVCPGPIDTAWTHNETSEMSWKMEKQMITATAMNRRGTPEEVANVYLFLASDDASYVTGALYTVDGGITISKGPVGLEADKSMQKAPEPTVNLRHTKQGATKVK